VIVVDASAISAILLREGDAESVLRSLEEEDSFLAPALLPFEVANVLATARRRGRIDDAGLHEARSQFFEFPWAFETAMGPESLRECVATSLATGLSTYDASYLQLALRHRCPLVTFDADLARVARAGGVGVRPLRG